MGGAGTGSVACARALSIASMMVIAACNATLEPPPAVHRRGTEADTPPKPSATPSLWFGGDVHLGTSARADLSAITAMMGDAGGVVNLEGSIAGGPGGARIATDGAVWLANPTETPDFLHNNGIIVASIANNHITDLGGEGAARTAAVLRVAGVAPVGGLAGAATLDVHGVRVHFLAHEVEEPRLSSVLRDELASAQLASGAEFFVVSLHVTEKPSYLPSALLNEVVDAAVSREADVIVVHGSHLVGPVEQKGKSIVAYGLGNLLFDCPCTTQTEAILLRVPLGPASATEIIPIRAGMLGAPATFAPDVDGILDLVAGLGGSPFSRLGGRGFLTR